MTEETSAGSAARPALPPQMADPIRPPRSPSTLLRPVTRRGRLVAAIQSGGLDLLTENGRFELLGSFDVDAREGDDVEILGVPAPQSRGSRAAPALLVRELRRLE
jgi:hypothetical protein